MNLTDRFGETVTFDLSLGDSSGIAINYLNNSETFRGIFSQLQGSSVEYTVKPLSSQPEGLLGPSSTDNFDPTTNTIYRSPTTALNTDLGGTITPALELAHELGHAYQSLTNPATFYWGNPVQSVGDYDNYDEFNDITNIETPIAEELNEAVRTDHQDYGTIEVLSPNQGASPNKIAAAYNAFPGFASDNGFTGLVSGYGANGATAGSITGSLLGDLEANAPSNQPRPKKH